MIQRRAIEALRAGVPNRDAVQALGCEQPEIERRFCDQLEITKKAVESGGQQSGFIISGDFGAGKSHLLEYLQLLALKENYVCSKVVISKETPLHDPVKLFRAAIHAAVVADRRGTAMVEIATRLRPGGQEYCALQSWLERPGGSLAPHFAATLKLYQKVGGHATELGSRIISFWSGDPLGVNELKRALREYGESDRFRIQAVSVRELGIQRFCFVPRLAVAAGYSGWVLLVDELELIGKYSPLQRAKSYAELARWLGKLKDQTFSGLCTVFANMSNFDSEVVDGKHDRENLPVRLKEKGLDEAAKAAKLGMEALRKDKLDLVRSGRDALTKAYDKIRSMYTDAYGWSPAAGEPEDRLASKSMRSHVRTWINQWDLERLYPGYRPMVDVREDEVQVQYDENPEIEHGTDEE
jgi:hypothetical protein